MVNPSNGPKTCNIAGLVSSAPAPKVCQGTSCHAWSIRHQCAANKRPHKPGPCGGSMATENSPTGVPPTEAETIVVSDEALLKAESFVEAEEGAANRLMGWAGKISTT